MLVRSLTCPDANVEDEGTARRRTVEVRPLYDSVLKDHQPCAPCAASGPPISRQSRFLLVVDVEADRMTDAGYGSIPRRMATRKLCATVVLYDDSYVGTLSICT